MTNFLRLRPEQPYEVYCTMCKQRESLPASEVDFLRIYHALHPRLTCRDDGTLLQVRRLKRSSGGEAV
jgi:hypothetical protein